MDNNCHNLIKQYLDYCDQNQIDIVRYDANEEIRKNKIFASKPIDYIFSACKMNNSGIYEEIIPPSNISCKDDFPVGDILNSYLRSNNKSYELETITNDRINLLFQTYNVNNLQYSPLSIRAGGNNTLDISCNKIIINKEIFEDFKTQEDYKCYYGPNYICDYVIIDENDLYASSSKYTTIDGNHQTYPCVFSILNRRPDVFHKYDITLIDRSKVDELFEFLKKEKEEVECQSHEFNTIIEHHQKIIKENKSKVTKIKNKSKKEIKKYIDSIKI